MKQSNLLITALAVLLLAGAGAAIAYLARENFDLKVEVSTLRYELEAAAKASPPLPSSAPAAAEAPADRTIGALTREVMIDTLSAESSTEKKLWIRVDPRDREAADFSREIADVFRDAGWEVVALDNQGLRFKPGLRMLVGAEDSPPSYVETAQRALRILSDPLTVGTGYIAYYEKKKSSPDFTGIPFLPGQTYVLWVGQKPEPTPAQ